MPYAAQADLANALGGEAVLVMLTDKSSSGAVDSATVSALLARAHAECDSAIQIAVSLPLASTPDTLKYVCADIAAFYAFQIGTTGMAMPENTRLRYEAATKWLDQIANRTRTLGTAAKAATDLQVQQVERSTDALPRYTFETAKGFIW